MTNTAGSAVPRWHVHSNDRERAQRIAAGDRDEFARLVREFHPLVYDLAFRMLTNRLDAEEVAQDAFLKIHSALAEFRAEASLKTWILRIAMRLSLNKRRDRSRNAWYRLGLHQNSSEILAATSEPTVPPSATPEGEYLSKEKRRMLLELIDRLPESLRQVLVLNSLEQLSYDEISRVLDVPVGTVSSRLYAARRRLRASLEELEIL